MLRHPKTYPSHRRSLKKLTEAELDKIMVSGFIIKTDIAGPAESVDLKRVSIPTAKPSTPKSEHSSSSSVQTPKRKKRRVHSPG